MSDNPTQAEMRAGLRWEWEALLIAREVIAEKKEADGAPNAARLIREGRWDDQHEVMDAYLGARRARRPATPSTSVQGAGEAFHETAVSLNVDTPPAPASAADDARARLVLAAAYERAGHRFDAANVRVIGKRDYADWKDHAALAAMLAYAALAQGASE